MRKPKLPQGFKWETCGNCLGQKHRTPLCPECKGKTTTANPKGPLYQRVRCGMCKGKGRVRKICYLCRGIGKTAIRM